MSGKRALRVRYLLVKLMSAVEVDERWCRVEIGAACGRLDGAPPREILCAARPRSETGGSPYLVASGRSSCGGLSKLGCGGVARLRQRRSSALRIEERQRLGFGWRLGLGNWMG